jgi:hypothetical protein
VTGGWLIDGNSASVATRVEQRRGIGGREWADGGSWPLVAEARERGWAGFTCGSGPGSVQSWAGVEKMAHDPFSDF